MQKRNICRLATILCGLVAITISGQFQLGPVTWYWSDTPPGSLVPGLLSAIFATQWIHYQKRAEETLNHPRWPTWLRRLLY